MFLGVSADKYLWPEGLPLPWEMSDEQLRQLSLFAIDCLHALIDREGSQTLGALSFSPLGVVYLLP